ncbi:MAG: glutamate--tRNA ligase [Candidatus Xiphinematobacter sp.]|nr:MAG: glutamate--tRNA ligase [Candidatus Xiphinematobacter sp.]
MLSEIRTRFAPSPTGYLHVGGARTALFNWIFSRKHGGKFVLRLEDTDEKRNVAESYGAVYDGLRWLGISWDEGPETGGGFGPYCQSQRNSIYESYFNRLEKVGVLYEEKGAFRFRSLRASIMVEDMVCGRVIFDMSNPLTHPDMTVRRSDGSWVFHFANVVDDIEMRITHVIRGEDHLSNTPKHVELYQALGTPPPMFAHIPLILNREGRKLSKRDSGMSIAAYAAQGYVPEGMLNYLTLLGWSPGGGREVLNFSEIQTLFDLESISRHNAIFDSDKCFWINRQHILQMTLERFTKLALPFIERRGIEYGSYKALLPVMAIVKEKIRLLCDVPDWASYFFTEEFTFDSSSVEKVLYSPNALHRLSVLKKIYEAMEDWNAAALEVKLRETAAELQCTPGDLIHPARVAVSGRSVGPSLYHMLEVIGKSRVLARFARALQKFT